MHFFLKAFSLLLRIAPKAIIKITYKIIYSLLFHVLKMRRKVVLENLKIAFPSKPDIWYYETMKACYKFFTNEFLDFLSYPRFFNNQNIKIENIEVIKEAFKQKKGVIFVGAHFGAFDKLFFKLNELKFDLTGVAYKQNSGSADIFFKDIRENFLKKQFYKGGDAKLLSKCLKENNGLILLSDQDAKKKGVVVKFFNNESSTHSGAAILSKRKKCPMVYFEIIKVDNYYNVKFKKISKSLGIIDIVQAYTKEIEKSIKKAPEQYFWFHKRWKTFKKYQ